MQDQKKSSSLLGSTFLAKRVEDNTWDKIIAGLPPEKAERFVEYRQKWDEVVSDDNIRLPFPLNIYFELIGSCNINCSYCFRRKEKWAQHAPEVFNEQRLGFDNFKKVIDEAKGYGLPAIWLGLSGEPFLEPDLVKMVKYASDNGVVDSIIVTNATLLTREKIEGLIDANLTRISISLNATNRDDYTRLCGADKFDTVAENIRLIAQIKKERNTVLPIVRITHIADLVEEDNTQEFSEYWKQYSDQIDIRFYQDWDFIEDIDTAYDRNCRCKKPQMQMSVWSNGDIASCHSMYSREDGTILTYGNIAKDSLKDIWDSAKVEEIRQTLLDGKLPCSSCARCQLQSEDIRADKKVRTIS